MSSATALVASRDLTKHWGSTTALAGVSIQVGHGITGLLGANGAGKTTLLKLVLGLSKPDGGTLEVLGMDPTHSGREIRARLGYAPEDDPLPEDMKAHDLVRHMAEVHGIPRRVATGRASDALWLVGLGEERFRPVGTMSTGQRQRTKLAQAIAHDPALVLLDEPTNGLDPVQREEMLNLIREVGRELGLDVILCSHLLGEVERVCDSAIVLDGGKLVADGTLDELRGTSDELVIFVDGAPDKFLAALKRLKVPATTSDGHVSVTLKSATTYDRVRDALASSKVPVRRMQKRSSSLEDVFFDRVEQ